MTSPTEIPHSPSARIPAGERPSPEVSGGPLPEGLLESFWSYEAALMTDDLAALDALFLPGQNTLRGDSNGILVGHGNISRFRSGRGGAPARTISRLIVRAVDADSAVTVAETAAASGGLGQQTQLWVRTEAGWKVAVAHVSASAPAIDSRVWRLVGTPLVAGRVGANLPLNGHTVAVKDLFDVAGFPVGAGVPEFLADAGPATGHATAVQSLLAAGADVRGIARTDEFAYSIGGRNPHYGTPPNPRVPGAVPGGSSSGPAAAVALGQATIGLGTDTAGSIRVPASYLGLWGLRTTHGAVDNSGLLPLADSFDTIGWLARDPKTLEAAAHASLASDSPGAPAEFAISPTLIALARPAVAVEFERVIRILTGSSALGELGSVEVGNVDELFEAFRIVQGAEAWRNHGEWISAHPTALGSDVAQRFAVASRVTAGQESEARTTLSEARRRLDAELGDRILLLPSTPSTAPFGTADQHEVESIRAATLRLTCIAAITGRPAVSAPFLIIDRAPAGFSLIGPRFSDVALIRQARTFAEALAR